MRRLAVDGESPSREVVEEAVAVLGRGGVVGMPTETFYGLAADALDEEACERVFAIKGRPAEKALPWIAADVAQVEARARLTAAGRRLAERFWPGPLTLVVPRRDAASGTVAVRVSGLPLARALAASLGRPITSTSANRAGEPPARSADALEALPGLDLLLDGGMTPGGAASTIVDVSAENGAKLVRPGAVPYETIVRVLAESPLIG